MDQQKRSKRIVIGVIIGFVLLCIVLVIYGLYRNNQTNNETYVDPGTGRTISDPANKADEIYGQVDSRISLIGGDELINQGVSFEQLQFIKDALTTYTKTVKGDHDEISVWINDITYTSKKDNNNRDKLTVPITVKRSFKTTMIVEYFDLNKVHVVVYKPNTTKVAFDSGILPQ